MLYMSVKIECIGVKLPLPAINVKGLVRKREKTWTSRFSLESFRDEITQQTAALLP